MESDRPSTRTRLLSSAENRYHPQQGQRSPGEFQLQRIRISIDSELEFLHSMRGFVDGITLIAWAWVTWCNSSLVMPTRD